MKYITLKSNDYPPLLADIMRPPKQLYLHGKIQDLPMVAVIGTRKMTDYGKQVTYRLSYDLAKAGLVVVSGLALGVDAIAHRAALDAGGHTMAVLGCGLDNIYPSRHQTLAAEIVSRGGCLVTEYENGTKPFKSHFPARNRIIAGLSLATIVTEADSKSGSLITANFALQENRQIMAVPGNIFSSKSCGPNNLIKAGAIAITSAIDVLAQLGLSSPALEAKPIKAESREEKQIIDLITQGVSSNQSLIDHTGIEAAQFAHIISLMEITGKIRNIGGGSWVIR